jgi:hypothetical protein
MMNGWHNLHQLDQDLPKTTPDGRSVPMRQALLIEVDGKFLGAAVEHELGVRFIAVDAQVTDMDQSIWPTVEYAYRSARQLYKARGIAF